MGIQLEWLLRCQGNLQLVISPNARTRTKSEKKQNIRIQTLIKQTYHSLLRRTRGQKDTSEWYLGIDKTLEIKRHKRRELTMFSSSKYTTAATIKTYKEKQLVYETIMNVCTIFGRSSLPPCANVVVRENPIHISQIVIHVVGVQANVSMRIVSRSALMNHNANHIASKRKEIRISSTIRNVCKC